MAHYFGDMNGPVPGPGSSLKGTGQLTDDLYLLAHRGVSGKPYLPPRALGAGLAAGLLAELMDGDTPAVTFRGGYLVPANAANDDQALRYPGLGEPVTRHVLDVAGRLERSGYRDWAHCALLRAQAAVDPGKAPERYAVLLAGLTFAPGLGFRFGDVTGGPVRSPDEVIRMLSPPLRELLAHVQATEASALLTTNPHDMNLEIPVSYPAAATAARLSMVSRALARDKLGVPAVLFFMLAGIAPLTVAAGVIPSAYATTGLTGIPAGFLVVAVVLGLFVPGYVAMSRVRMTAPALSFLLLGTIVALAVLHYATLLGVAPGSEAAWILPASYGAVAVIGLCWAAILRFHRPRTYATIGLGANAATAQIVPVPGRHS
jgi:hypothetical protein